MTKKQLIALFEAMETNARECAKAADELGDREMSEKEKGMCLAYGTVINALKNPKFAKELAEIYEVAC